MTETLIKIEELHKSFGKNEVLKGINLEIKRGEVVVIIGPSGSGKSTLLRSMNLLEEVTNFLSLALRVFGNIFAGEVMASLLITLSHQALYWYPVAFVTNLVWTAFSVFISCVQAYVFTVLSSMYLGNKINDEE